MAQAAAAADLAVVFVGTSSKEGADRVSLSFPDDQNAAVAAAAKAAPHKTVVVAFNPGAALMPWSKDVNVVLTMFLPGLEVGHALADILFGDVNPTGEFSRIFGKDVSQHAIYGMSLKEGQKYW